MGTVCDGDLAALPKSKTPPVSHPPTCMPWLIKPVKEPLIFSAFSSEVVLFNCLSSLILQLKSLGILFLGGGFFPGTSAFF